jgi:hypothetical protein
MRFRSGTLSEQKLATSSRHAILASVPSLDAPRPDAPLEDCGKRRSGAPATAELTLRKMINVLAMARMCSPI